MSHAGPPKLRTTGVMAKELKEPPHRVQHVLASRSHIAAVALAGIIKLYDRKALAQVRHELNAIDARRADKGAANA